MSNTERAEHHAAKAEELLEWVSGKKMKGPDVQIVAARANTHATLAVFYGAKS